MTSVEHHLNKGFKTTKLSMACQGCPGGVKTSTKAMKLFPLRLLLRVNVFDEKGQRKPTKTTFFEESLTFQQKSYLLEALIFIKAGSAKLNGGEFGCFKKDSSDDWILHDGLDKTVVGNGMVMNW